MRILLTNDDGVGAPGLSLLQQIASEFGDVVIVAPDRQQSGISHKLSFERPLKIESFSDQVYGVNGTPADCVRVAIAKFGSQFDWVLSGINDGANLGCDVFYSGTVAAAREACLQRIPAIAISQYRQHYAADFDWKGQASAVRRVFESYLTTELSAERWININLPDIGAEQTAEIVQCDVDTNPLPACYVEADGHWEWRLRYADRPRDIGKDTDVCLSGGIAVSLCDIV